MSDMLSGAALFARHECAGEDISLVYLAAPYSDPSPLVMRCRAKETDWAAVHLIQRMDYAVFSPISHGQRLVESGGKLPLDAKSWSSVNNRILEVADALFILALPGWERSRGVAAELGLARRQGIPVTLMLLADGDYRLLPAPTAPEVEAATSLEPQQRVVLILDAINTMGELAGTMPSQSGRAVLDAVRDTFRELLALFAPQGCAA